MQRKNVEETEVGIGIVELPTEDGDKQANSNKNNKFQTLVVMEFDHSVTPETVQWIVEKLNAPQSNGGANLLATTAITESKKGSSIHISATTERMLVAAELMELKKPYHDGSLREISAAEIANFQNSEDLDNLLTLAEKQRIVKHEVDLIRALEMDTHIPGNTKLELYKGEAIVPMLTSKGVITKLYPLHDKEALKVLGTEWYRAFFKEQPIEKIQNYFGETVAMYFAFLGNYTMALIPPALIGILSAFYHSMYIQIFFCIFNIVWATFFLESWKRNCASWAYKWGTLGTEQFEEARAAYHGELGVNKVTGRLEPRYPKWKKKMTFYCVSVPVVLFSLFVAFQMMLLYFWMQEGANLWYKESPSVFTSLNALCVPSAVYAILINISNMIFRKVAYALNDWENHRLQSAYENHLIVKLVAFDFVNCFMSLFYVAFYMQDMVLLRSHLASLLIMTQIIGQIMESVVPYVLYKRKKAQIKSEKPTIGGSIEPLLMAGDVDSATLLQAHIESTKNAYDGTLDDYLEMFLQFGYVFLFSAVFPSAAFWALINNITEIRTDAFKMCRIFQRPFARPVANIGAWLHALEIMSAMAVVTNCALIALSPKIQEAVTDFSQLQVIMWIVIAEHVLLFVKVMISYMIPDYPEWVETAMSRVEYESKQAWRKERTQAAKSALYNKSKAKDMKDEGKVIEQVDDM